MVGTVVHMSLCGSTNNIYMCVCVCEREKKREGKDNIIKIKQ